MRVRSIRDLQVAARSRRLERGQTQREVPVLGGVSRKWLVGFESGAATAAELALVLRLFAALDLPLFVGDDPAANPTEHDQIDLRAHLAELNRLAGGPRDPGR